MKSLKLENILELYQKGEPAAFEEFYARTSRFIFNYLYQRLKDRQDAEEVCQEIYARVHKYVTTYNSQQNAMTWTIAIAKNAVLDFIEVHSRHREVANAAATLREGEESTLADERLKYKELVAQLFKDLTPAEQELVLQRLIDGASYEKIAGSSHTSVVSARKRISRILRRLRSFRSTS